VEREKLVALMSALESHLSEIDAALEQDAEGVYGICEVCGQPIDPERLAIMPEATMCVRCKEHAERQHKAGTRRNAAFDEMS
jgi:RNA polymerase-binding transcription factor DksA